MKIVISAGGRFHALQLTHQLEKRNSFLKLFSFSYTNKDQGLVAPSLVHNIRICNILDFMFLRLRLSCLINSSKFNHVKDNIFDYLVSKKLKNLGSFDLFIGWAHYAENSLLVARKAGAIIIIESGSSHILEQQRLLEQEYKKWGVNFAPIHPKVISKMVREYELADYIMTLSSASQESFIKHGVPEHKVLRVPCGIDVGYFMEAVPLLRPGGLEGQASSTSPEPKKSQVFRIIFVGLINIRKGIPYLLEAWKQANLPEDTSELVLVGSLQKDMAQFLSKQKLKKNTIFYGSTNRETLKELYYQSSVFVLPSVEDGFGMVMGEAMACGLPVICTTNTGAPDVIKDGVHGFFVQPQDSLALAEKITWCYEHKDTCYTMGQAGRKRIHDFTLDTYGERVFEVYKKILENK